MSFCGMVSLVFQRDTLQHICWIGYHLPALLFEKKQPIDWSLESFNDAFPFDGSSDSNGLTHWHAIVGTPHITLKSEKKADPASKGIQPARDGIRLSTPTRTRKYKRRKFCLKLTGDGGKGSDSVLTWVSKFFISESYQDAFHLTMIPVIPTVLQHIGMHSSVSAGSSSRLALTS
jgi:hypothetical protein